MSHLQALYARRREVEHDRIERTEAANKYFDYWSKVTARFENWTAPDYYKQADEQLKNSKRQEEKQKTLSERRKKLAQLLETENKSHEEEMQEKRSSKKARRSVDDKILKKIDDNLKEQQQIRRKLELEAKLYGKWRHGVEDDNLIFESKSDNEVLAKLNWLDKQIDQQLEREKEEEAAKERQLKLQLELNKCAELRKERQQIRESEIREIRCMQAHHLEQLKEKQRETDELKEKQKQLQDNLNDLKKELELLEESYSVLTQNVDFGESYNFNKIKIFTRKRSEVFCNQINLCLSILERIMDFSEKPKVLCNFKKCLERQKEREVEKLWQIEGMYESEAKYSLKRSEELWQQEHTERYNELKQILMEEYRLINNSLREVIKTHEELVEIRSTHLGAIENSSEKLNLLMQEEENSPRCKNAHDIQPPHQASQLEESDDTRQMGDSGKSQLLKSINFSSRRNCSDSVGNNMSPRYNNVNRISNSFSNLNLDARQINPGQSSQRDLESHRTNSHQPTMYVVTPENKAERSKFGRKRVAWN